MTAPDPKAHQMLAGLAQQAAYVHDFAKTGQQTEALEHAAAVDRLITAWRLAAGHADREAIHRHFGLSYANYLVLPRTLLQSMPDEWQARFVALLDEMDTAFAHVPKAEDYKVSTGTWTTVDEMGDVLQTQLGITQDWYDEPVPEDLGPSDLNEWRFEHEKDQPVYRDKDGQVMAPDEPVFVASPDPVPHYNRGRARVEPQMHHCDNCEGIDPSSCLMNAGRSA